MEVREGSGGPLEVREWSGGLSEGPVEVKKTI